MLKIRNLNVKYGAINALRRVSMDIEEGETVILVGANGAGKSSLIQSVIGLVRPTSGTIEFQGKSLIGLSSDKCARAGIGYSPEGRKVFANMSVEDNVLAGASFAPKAQRLKTFSWLNDLFPMLVERAKQPAGQLSGGQQQIVAFARALGTSPKLLLLDEPFLGLAPVWIGRISEAIREIQRRGTTILMSEQMARPALKLAHRGYVIRSGELKFTGDARTLQDAALNEAYL